MCFRKVWFMEFAGLKEYRYQKAHLNQVKHITINPNGPGVVRIHMVPPKLSFLKDVPYVLIINGQDILPLNLSWAILLSAFIDEMYRYENREISDDEWTDIVNKTVSEVQKVYKKVPAETLSGDLMRIIETLTDIARGKQPFENIGIISLGDYAKYMTAPHRMDLMISSMCKDGKWNCNQQCVHCYAAGEELAQVKELTTGEWKKIIDKCRKAINKSYNADEVLDIDFSIHQSYMYKINYSDSTVSYRFTPGWFEEINVNAIKILWNSKNVASSDCETTDGDYLVWSGSLAAGEKKTVNISYKTSALNVDPEKQNENSVFISDNNETITSWIGIILVVGILVLQFVRKTRSKYKGGFGRSGHIGSFGGHCACASSCACACAGGGRAGCSAKNFYGASVDAEKLKKAINRK